MNRNYTADGSGTAWCTGIGSGCAEGYDLMGDGVGDGSGYGSGAGDGSNGAGEPDGTGVGRGDADGAGDDCDDCDYRFIGRVCMVRTYSAGVFFGVLESLRGTAAILSNARRIWGWTGAATLSELSQRGVTDRENETKIPMAVPWVMLTEAVEIIPMSGEAIANLTAVPEWTAIVPPD